MDTDFDVLVLGTGLTQSIISAALAKAGFKVAQVDENAFYGSDDASLSFDELVQWAEMKQKESSSASSSNRFTSISLSTIRPPDTRQFSISLSPSIIPSTGAFISSLVSSGVARYGGFRLLERTATFKEGTLINVPSSKEDVFKNKAISLVEKRRLMRFLTFAVSDFESKPELVGKEQTPFLEFLHQGFALNREASETIAFSLAFCSSSSDTTLPALIRMKHYLTSVGRYGPSAFLVGHYGGAGEIAQGFCRTCAVNGGVYILGRPIHAVHHDHLRDGHPQYSIALEDVPDVLTADVLITSPSTTPQNLQAQMSSQPPRVRKETAARCVAIFDSPINFPTRLTSESAPSTEPIDSAALVFPPNSVQNGSTTASVFALTTGVGTMSAPKGKYILYLSMQVPNSVDVFAQSAQSILEPYLQAVSALTVDAQSSRGEPSTTPNSSLLFYLFYFERQSIDEDSSDAALYHNCIVVPEPPSHISELPDSSARDAEAMFWKSVEVLKASPLAQTRKRPVPSAADGEPSENSTFPEVEGFWPALGEDDSGDTDGW